MHDGMVDQYYIKHIQNIQNIIVYRCYCLADLLDTTSSLAVNHWIIDGMWLFISRKINHWLIFISIRTGL